MTEESASAPVPVHWKLVIDAHDPHGQADFWAAALGYLAEDNSALVRRLLDAGALPAAATVDFHGRPAFRDLIAVRHPGDPYDADTGTGLAGGCCSSACPSRRPSRTGSTWTCTRARAAATPRWSG
ncbi:Glyoxalase-like domain-containing protein OS=Streptomyces glaucescens OX=1907 GN=SGLAU_19795 PE=4 SV=1 [Streptomyces glaucescens]